MVVNVVIDIDGHWPHVLSIAVTYFEPFEVTVEIWAQCGSFVTAGMVPRDVVTLDEVKVGMVDVVCTVFDSSVTDFESNVLDVEEMVEVEGLEVDETVEVGTSPSVGQVNTSISVLPGSVVPGIDMDSTIGVTNSNVDVHVASVEDQ